MSEDLRKKAEDIVKEWMGNWYENMRYEKDPSMQALALGIEEALASSSAREEGLRKEIATLQSRAGKIFEALEEYGVHGQRCICSQWREGRPTKNGGYETLYGYGKDEKWYQKDEEPVCSCGFRQALAEFKGEK